MIKTVFLRVLDPPPDEKGTELARLTTALRDRRGAEDLDAVFLADPNDFAVIPRSPFAYWAGESLVRIFRAFPPLEGSVGTVKVGLQTSEDFRFVRTWWEVDPACIGFSPEDADRRRGWVHFAKGGSYSPYYADLHLVVNWFGRGEEVKNRLNPRTGLPWSNVWMLARTERDYFFRPGLTWSRRTVKGFSLRQFPTGAIFADKGPVIFPADDAALLALLAIGNSRLASDLIHTHMAAGSYEAGVIQRTPVPRYLGEGNFTGISEVVELLRRPVSRDETTHDFKMTSLAGQHSRTLTGTLAELGHQDRKHRTYLNSQLEAIEQHVRGLYEFEEDGLDAAGDKHGQPSGNGSPEVSASWQVANLLLWCVGAAFGRWDVRMARDASLIPELQSPFDRLPRVAPGGLVGPDGLPATRNRIASEAWLRARTNPNTLPEPASFEGPDHIMAADYPVQVAWDGVLVDDPGHPCDIVGRVREVFRFVYGPGRAEAIEAEAVEILRAGRNTPRSLRDWFRNQKAGELGLSFFDFHIRRYSKSRRKAPIYWRLCTNSGRNQSRYGVWLYYHGLTDDTLWTVLNDYVGPRREREERQAEELKRHIEGATGSEIRKLERERERSVSLIEELEAFEAGLRSVAESGWVPDLDDGVVINLAPLHALVPWEEPEKVWKKFENGDYDWAHLALRYWPERVREKCRTDKSLAIAHRLEELYQDE